MKNKIKFTRNYDYGVEELILYTEDWFTNEGEEEDK